MNSLPVAQSFLNLNGEIDTGRIGEIQPVGWLPPPNLSLDEWLQIGTFFFRVDDSMNWIIGDWLAYGEHKWGETYAQALQEGTHDYQALADLAWVSRSVQFSDRSENLSWTHHRAVAKFDADTQVGWLHAAEENGWSVRDLKEAIRTIRQHTIGTTSQLELPTSTYRIIYADPPWQYASTGVTVSRHYGSTDWHYPTMTLDELCELPIEDLADDDAVLFMWATSPKLPDALALMQAWGFEYKTSFVWDKVKHNFGYYNSVRHEFLLIGGRGSSTPDVKKLHDSVITLERTSTHSEKPQYFREMIDSLYTTGSRIELFARTAAQGWERWGYEAND